MNKKKDNKRKEILSIKAKNESFRFQIWWNKKKRELDIPDDDPLVNKELDVICEKGLTDGLLALADVLKGAKNNLGYLPEPGKCSLNGAAVPYILGIVDVEPAKSGHETSPLADANKISLPLQIDVYYDNEYRNRVADWVKERYRDVTTRLGQPALKFPNMVVVFKRVLKS